MDRLTLAFPYPSTPALGRKDTTYPWSYRLRSPYQLWGVSAPRGVKEALLAAARVEATALKPHLTILNGGLRHTQRARGDDTANDMSQMGDTDCFLVHDTMAILAQAIWHRYHSRSSGV